MRRLLSILLFAATLMPLAAPLLATGAAAQSDVPMCCRRDGKHHCMMGNVIALLGGSGKTTLQTLQEKCPYQQHTVAVVHHQMVAMPDSTASSAVVSHAMSASAQAECMRRISFDRSRQKRGPPVLLS